MTQPKIFDTKPVSLTLQPGTYYWCQCGQSQKQPFCDGAHKGTAFAPKAFKVAAEKKVFLCNCKQTKTSPYCDGSHNDLD